MHLHTKTLLGLGLLASALLTTGGGCTDKISDTGMFKPETVTVEGVNDSTIAMSLLQFDDVYMTMNNLRPSLPELNSKLDDSLNNYDYVVARTWYNRDTGNSAIQNAITQYPSAEVAVSENQSKGEGYTQLTSALSLGDSHSAYFLPEDADYPAEVVYRFTMGQFGIKVSVVKSDDTVLSDEEIQNQLLPQAEELARKQQERFGKFLSEKSITIPKNTALEKLPETLQNAEVVGALPFSDIEWLGVISDMSAQTMTGFQSGAFRRFHLTNRPTEIVEVSVIELDTEANAEYLQEGLLETTKDQGVKELTLPDTIADQSDGISDVTIVETQSYSDNYFVDVVIFSPFGEMDTAAAEQDVISYTEETLNAVQK